MLVTLLNMIQQDNDEEEIPDEIIYICDMLYDMVRAI